MWSAICLLFMRQTGSRHTILEVCKFRFWQFRNCGGHIYPRIVAKIRPQVNQVKSSQVYHNLVVRNQIAHHTKLTIIMMYNKVTVITCSYELQWRSMKPEWKLILGLKVSASASNLHLTSCCISLLIVTTPTVDGHFRWYEDLAMTLCCLLFYIMAVILTADMYNWDFFLLHLASTLASSLTSSIWRFWPRLTSLAALHKNPTFTFFRLMAPLPVPLNDLEGHICCLKTF